MRQSPKTSQICVHDSDAQEAAGHPTATRGGQQKGHLYQNTPNFNISSWFCFSSFLVLPARSFICPVLGWEVREATHASDDLAVLPSERDSVSRKHTAAPRRSAEKDHCFSRGKKKKKKEKSISLSKDRSNFRADIFLSWSCSLAQAPCCNRQLREGFFCFFFSGNHRLELLRMAPSAPEGRYRRLLLLTGKEERICREDLGLKPLLPCTNFLA